MSYNRNELCDDVTQAYVDGVDMDDIIDFFFQEHLKMWKDGSDEMLIDDALSLSVIDEEWATGIKTEGWG